MCVCVCVCAVAACVTGEWEVCGMCASDSLVRSCVFVYQTGSEPSEHILFS